MGPLNDSPADILRKLLVDLGLGVWPPIPKDQESTQWPIYATGEPPSPDNCITVYDTTGVKDGRMMSDGAIDFHHGFMVRLRAAMFPRGFAKANDLAEALDKQVQDNIVTMSSGAVYKVYVTSRTGDVISLGRDTPTSKRSVFTINGICHLKRIAAPSGT